MLLEYELMDYVKTPRIRQHFRTRPSTFAQTLSSRIYDTFILDTKIFGISVNLKISIFELVMKIVHYNDNDIIVYII